MFNIDQYFGIMPSAGSSTIVLLHYKRHRVWEHYQSVQQRTASTAMGKHYIEKHTELTDVKQPFKVTVKRQCKDYVDRQLWQSVLIKRQNPKLNVQLAENRAEGDWVKNTWKIM